MNPLSPTEPASRSVSGAVRAHRSVFRDLSIQLGLLALFVTAASLWFGRDTWARLGPGREALLVAGLVVGVALLTLSLFLLLVLIPRLSLPAGALADVAEAVAAGNLDASAGTHRATGEMRRLALAIEAMVAELSRVVSAMHESSRETASLATEITSGTDHMASAATQMAETSSELSRQSTEMAQTIQEMAEDANRLMEIAAVLATGGHEGVDRNRRVRALAQENRQRLNQSSKALETLAGEVQSNASAVEALAGASEEIKAFVTFVQKMARQSKLLALNAAMEAARAGEHGQGFAVVATEVRRLAAGASEAAERTEIQVRSVLERVAESRSSSARAVGTVAGVLEATRHSFESFQQVEDAVVDSESWVASIEQAATTSSDLVTDMTTRLDALARGTESFAAAMQQVAASGEEQSASTLEIAAAAASLLAAAERLSALVSTFALASVRTPPPPKSDQEIAAEREAAETERERRRTVEMGDPAFA